MVNYNKHSNSFNKAVDEIFREMQKNVLDYAECAIEGKDRWKSVRRQVLTATNSAKRKLQDEIRRNWEVRYEPDTVYEHIINVKQSLPVKERKANNVNKESKKD